MPGHSPGFTVGVLADLRLNNHMNLRLSPGMQFGSKTVKWHDALNPDAPLSSQNVKSTFVVMPLDLKVSALRYGNVRPYVVGGVMGVLDVSKRRREQLQFKKTDAMLTGNLTREGFGFRVHFIHSSAELLRPFSVSKVVLQHIDMKISVTCVSEAFDARPHLLL